MCYKLNFSLLMILFAVFLKEILLWAQRGYNGNFIDYWDRETWPYIISSLDYLIFREINSYNKF